MSWRENGGKKEQRPPPRTRKKSGGQGASKPNKQKSHLVDGHLEPRDVFPRGRHDDARAARGAGEPVGLLDVQGDARGVVDEAREVEERGDGGAGAERGHGGGGREGGTFF